MRRFAWLLALALFLLPDARVPSGAAAVVADRAPAAHGQQPDIRVEADVLVGGATNLPYTEPHIAVDPEDSDHLLVASIVGFSRARGQHTWGCATMLSRDGGRSWREQTLALGHCGDPWLALQGETAWFASLHDYRPREHGLAVYRSADGGGTWEAAPTIVGRGHDHPTLVRGRRGGVYVVSSYLARRISYVSVFPLGVPGLPAERRLERYSAIINTLQPVARDDGSLVVPVSAFSRFVAGRQERIEPSDVSTVAFDPPHRAFAGPSPVTRRCGSRKGFAGAAVDASGGRFHGRLYLACTTLRGGDVLVFSSADGGVTWGEPVPVLGVPEPPDENPALRRAVGIAVNAHGAVGVVWQDRGGDPSRRCQVQRFAASLDGGASFSDPVDLSGAPSCPDAPRNRAAARQWPAGTDYGAVVATPDGRFRAVWADARTGIYQIRMATVSVS